jgi:phosphomethylpyrimidine synthase
MNANEKFLASSAQVDEAAVAPLPNSRKIYVEGSRPDIRVPMREISQADTPTGFGGEKNPPIFVYDCSGPYTDPPPDRHPLRPAGPAPGLDRGARRHRGAARPDLRVRPPARRRPALDELRFPGLHRKPRRALPGKNVSQMHYARQGSSPPRWNTWRSART